MEQEKEYLLSIIKPFVTHPEDVNVEATTDELGVLLRVRVNQEDMGRLIGKQGANANAIRTLVRQLGFTSNKRISIKIDEPEGATMRMVNATDEVDNAFNEAKGI